MAWCAACCGLGFAVLCCNHEKGVSRLIPPIHCHAFFQKLRDVLVPPVPTSVQCGPWTPCSEGHGFRLISVTDQFRWQDCPALVLMVLARHQSPRSIDCSVLLATYKAVAHGARTCTSLGRRPVDTCPCPPQKPHLPSLNRAVLSPPHLAFVRRASLGGQE